MNDRLCEALKQQAQIWKQEARTQAETVRDCYQACTGSTGEPGDWNGVAPIRATLDAKDAEILRLRAEVQSAVAAEREACAKVCEEQWDAGTHEDKACQYAADEIRKRSNL